MVVTGNCADLEGLLLVAVEVDFHSFFGFGFVQHLRPNEKEEAISSHFSCEDGEGRNEM